MEKKYLLEITVLEQFPDWAKTDLPAGVYLCTNTLYFYRGDKTFPYSYFPDPEIFRLFKDQTPAPEAGKKKIAFMTPGGMIEIDDLLKILVAARGNPDNLPGEILLPAKEESK
jgi:hypothetical protein